MLRGACRRRARGVRRDPGRVRRAGCGRRRAEAHVRRPGPAAAAGTRAPWCASSRTWPAARASTGSCWRPACCRRRRSGCTSARATARSRTSASTRRSRSRGASPRTSDRRPPGLLARGQRPTVTLTHAEWSDPVATALRLAMWHDIEVRYPEIAASTPGGFDVDDPQQGVGALSTVLAWIDGRPVGCATLRAARDGYPAGSAELKKVWVDESARGSGAARALLAAIEDDARAHGPDQRGPADGDPAARGGLAVPVGGLPPGGALLRLRRRLPVALDGQGRLSARPRDLGEPHPLVLERGRQRDPVVEQPAAVPG